MFGKKLTQTNQAEVGQIRLPIRVTRSQRAKLRQVFIAIEINFDQSLLNHRQGYLDAAQMESGFGQNRLTGEQRVRHLLGDGHGPFVMLIASIGKGDEKSRVGDAFHAVEKPLRRDKVRGPLTDPAKRINDRPPLAALAFSNCSRTICPCATPDFLAASSNQEASSFPRRIVIV